MRLTDLECKNAKPGPKVRKLSDGGGLQLWIQPAGSRQWRFAYKFDGKQKVFAIGQYPLVSLAEARVARDDAKRLLLQGVDPRGQLAASHLQTVAFQLRGGSSFFAA